MNQQVPAEMSVNELREKIKKVKSIIVNQDCSLDSNSLLYYRLKYLYNLENQLKALTNSIQNQTT